MTDRTAARLALAGIALGLALTALGLAWRASGLPMLVDPACDACAQEVDQ